MTSPTPKVLTEADLAGLPRAVSHTPGKLIVRGGFSLYAEDRKTPVADACLNASIATHDECNARRLAACWNALEGVPTEEIETVLIHGKAIKDVVSERDELASRVTKLTKALTEARRWIGDGECSDGLPREYWTGDHTAAVELVDAALNASKEQP